MVCVTGHLQYTAIYLLRQERVAKYGTVRGYAVSMSLPLFATSARLYPCLGIALCARMDLAVETLIDDAPVNIAHTLQRYIYCISIILQSCSEMFHSQRKSV